MVERSLSMFARYDTTEPSDARGAMRRLDDLLESKADRWCNIAANAEKGLRETPQSLEISGSPGRTPFTPLWTSSPAT
jgi:hypothetical protein